MRLSRIYSNEKLYLLLFVVVMSSFKSFSQQRVSDNDSLVIPQTLILGTSDILIPDYSVATLKKVKRSGVKYIEVTWYKYMEETQAERLEHAHKVLRNAKRAGLILWSTHLPYGKDYDISNPDEKKRQQAVKRQKRFIDLALVMHVGQMILHPSFEPIPEDSREAHIEACRKSLKELLVYIRGKPVQLDVEDLPRTCLGNTSQEMLRILKGMPDLGVCFDANHLLQEKPKDFIEAVGNNIRTVHISDYDGIDEKHWMPGRGINNWNKIIEALVKVHYSGPFMYEVVSKYASYEDLNNNYKRLFKDFR